MPRGSLITSGSSPPKEPAQAQTSGLSGHQAPGVMPLQGWHLPLLTDPSFLDLQPLLQRLLLLALPKRLIGLLRLPTLPAPQALVASAQPDGMPLGLLVSRCLNRRGSSWAVQHLRLANEAPVRATALALLREQIHRIPDAASWVIAVSSLDQDRLGLLRELGFQPLRAERLWRWDQAPAPGRQPLVAAPGPGPAADLQLRSLQRRTASLHWHLEQAASPPQLRQLLDRRVDDLLDDSQAGWMLVDPCRGQAVAGIRLLVHAGEGGQEASFAVHPLWRSALGPASQALLEQARQKANQPLILSVDSQDGPLNQWLEAAGAECCGERVLMVRSVWRRQLRHPAPSVALRLGAVLEQWQPPRPIPTPSLRPQGAGMLLPR